MSVFKRTIKGKKSRNYTLQYTDENGVMRRKASGTSDKRLATQLRDKEVDRVRKIRSGLVSPTEERMRDESRKPLAGHVADYLAACRGQGQDKRAVEDKTRALEDWFLDVAGDNLDAIRADKVDTALSALQASGRSARTVNLKLEAASSLLNWCVKNQRLTSNPLRVIPKRNVILDRRVVRRVLTEQETTALVAVARQQTVEHLAVAEARGREDRGAPYRALWYLFPLHAGLRRGDNMRMTWGDLDLKAKTPTLTIRGGKAKTRVDVLPLRAVLVSELKRLKPKNVLPSARVFPTAVTHATRKKDLLRAGIVLEKPEGRADLHALRHTFGTRLAEQGCPPAKLQKLMRHATIELTMRYYVHLDVESLAEGLELLPRIERAS